MSESNTNHHGIWQRDERVIAYLSQWRARYVSITKTRAGQLLILFTQQSQDQEQAGQGDLQLLRRWEDGKWWHPPVSVHDGDGFVPQANGTLTTLHCGQIIAPFVEATNNPMRDRVRMITSDDDGKSWDVSEPISIAPLIWATPYARPVELDNKIIMPIYGALSEADLEQTRLVCGLLQSTDGGKTWGDFSVIAGPDPNAEVSYEFPALAPFDDGPDAKLVAVVTARRLKVRPNLPLDVTQTLMRVYSSDGGKTWSEPENLCVGSWPNLARMEDGTIACSFAIWAGWGVMEVILSDDGLQTVRQLIPGSAFVNHGWLPGWGPSEWGRGWARNPIPLPPVVPNLEGDWSGGHYGFSSILPLDGDHFMVAIGQRQRDQYDKDTPIELEQVETISIERIPAPPPAGPSGRHGEPRGQWHLAERWSVEQWQQNTKQPAGDDALPGHHHILTLNDGRWVSVNAKELIPDWYEDSEGRELGHEHGYTVKTWGYGPLARTIGDRSVNRLEFSYTDDRAKTWQDGQLKDPSPLRTATFIAGPFFEESDGTIVAVMYGYQTPQDIAEHFYSCFLVRSHDHGQTWGDWSMVAYDPMRRFNYCEASLVVVPDGTWVTFMRTEAIRGVPFSIIITRSVSSDRGRTWSQPEPCGAPGVYGGLWLPDGGIATAAQNTCSWGLTISYDYGRTWPYALPATYAPTRMGVLDEETFWIYDQHGAIVSVYKR